MTIVSVTIGFAHKLEAVTTISAATWMNYQESYDFYSAASDNAPTG